MPASKAGRDMDATVRRLRILQLIPRGIDNATTRREIQNRLRDNHQIDAEPKTVLRDLVKLGEAGFPICSDEAPRDRQYWWEGNDLLEIPGMSRDSALTFRLAGQFLQPLLPQTVMQSIQPHLAEAETVLTQRHAASAAKWTKKVRLVRRHLESVPAVINPDVLAAVHQALFQEKKLKINYVSRQGGRPRVHTLNPLGLIYRNSTSELVAQPVEKPDVGRYMLHRMKKAEVLDEQTSVPMDFDLDTFIATQLAFPQDGKEINLKLLVTAEKALYLKETPVAPNQRLSRIKDGQYHLTASIRRTPELQRWILGHGSSVAVLEPEDYRLSIQQTIKETLKLYR